MRQRGMSVVIGTVLLLALVVVAAAIIWGLVTNMIENNLEDADTCFAALSDRLIRINDEYTCYDAVEDELRIAIDRDDVVLDSLLLSIANGEDRKSYTITEAGVSPEGDLFLPSDADAELPGRGGGYTYRLRNVMGGVFPEGDPIPRAITISPKISGTQCEQVDSTLSVGNC